MRPLLAQHRPELADTLLHALAVSINVGELLQIVGDPRVCQPLAVLLRLEHLAEE